MTKSVKLETKKDFEEEKAPLLRVTYTRSMIGNPVDQKATVKALGLRQLNHTVILPNTPSVQGMVRKVRHLVTVEGAQAMDAKDTGAPEVAEGANVPAPEDTSAPETAGE